MLVRAEPYYLSRDVLTQDYRAEWRVNGTVLDNPSDDPLLITLRAGGEGGGIFDIGFRIQSTEQLLQGAQGNFALTF